MPSTACRVRRLACAKRLRDAPDEVGESSARGGHPFRSRSEDDVVVGVASAAQLDGMSEKLYQRQALTLTLTGTLTPTLIPTLT